MAIDYVTGESWESSETPQVTSKGNATITTAAAARADKAAGSANGSKADSGIGAGSSGSNAGNANGAGSNNASSQGMSEQQDYILNVKNKKFHKPDCSAASDISSANKQDFTGTSDQLIARGYSPCGICKP